MHSTSLLYARVARTVVACMLLLLLLASSSSSYWLVAVAYYAYSMHNTLESRVCIVLLEYELLVL